MAITINGTTGISGVDGSAATPALQGADTNTGISFGTDTVTINTGGVARVTTDASGNVGIGTSSPGSRLDVVAQDAIRITGFQPFQTWRDSNDSNKGFRIQTAGGNTLFSNDNTGGGTYTERMRIDSSGRVAINGAIDSLFRLSVIDTSANKVLKIVGAAAEAYGAGGAVLIQAPNDPCIEFFNTSIPAYGRVLLNGNNEIGFSNSASGALFTHTFAPSGVAGKRDGAGSWVGISDERLKTAFSEISPQDAWSRINLLEPTNYEWAVAEAHETQLGVQRGFKAQNWQQAYPSSTYEMTPSEGEKHLLPDGEKAIGIAFNADFYADLVACIKELKAELDSVKAELATLKGAA